MTDIRLFVVLSTALPFYCNVVVCRLAFHVYCCVAIDLTTLALVSSSAFRGHCQLMQYVDYTELQFSKLSMLVINRAL